MQNPPFKNKVLLGDCLELMKDIPTGSVDMILCDLPYGTTACKWDTIIPFDALWKQYERVIKDNGAIVLTASQPFTSALIMSNPKLFRYEWIWEKNRGSNFANVKYMPFKEHENVLVFYKKKPTYNPERIYRTEKSLKRDPIGSMSNKYGVTQANPVPDITGFKRLKQNTVAKDGKRMPRSIIKFDLTTGKNEFRHPTQKPVALFEYLIKTYTDEGDLILDNCAGSGTTAIACLNTKRNYICIEKEPEYYDIIEGRIKEYKREPVFF